MNLKLSVLCCTLFSLTGAAVVDISGLGEGLLELEEQLGEQLVGEDTEYDYKIPYTKTDWKEDYELEAPSCGRELNPLMDVSKMEHPNQIRLSFTGDPTEMALTWTTNNVNHINEVRYGLLQDSFNYTAFSISHQYDWYDNNSNTEPAYTSGFIHEALLINLEPGRIHYYQIVSNDIEHTVTRFIAAPEHGSDTPLSFFHIGDVGVFGSSVMVTYDMIKNMEEKDYAGLLHCGDISYANKWYNAPEYIGWPNRTATQQIWDTWGMMVEPLGSKLGYMVTPGNHELDVYDSSKENNTIYSKRFIMPGNERYFSFGVGMVHFISVSTDESIDPTSTQHRWLDRKLEYLNKNRDKWPWIVAYQHRPIYNSNAKHKIYKGKRERTVEVDAYTQDAVIGWPEDYNDLLLKYHVDLVLNGHVHHYERTWPVSGWEDDEVYKSYENVSHPIHITCGHGGKSLYKTTTAENGTIIDRYTYPPPEYTAERDHSVWGHCELDFVDSTTVIHKMYEMGSTKPKVNLKITKFSHPISFAVQLHSVNVMLVCVLLVLH